MAQAPARTTVSRRNPLDGTSMRQAPSRPETEQALLGAILTNNRAFHAVAEFLRPEHFADSVHAMIFVECAKVITAGEKIDAVLMKERLQYRDELDTAGGTAYLASLLTAMVYVDQAEAYGRAIVDAWIARELVSVGEILVNGALDRVEAPRDLAARAVAKIDSLQIVQASRPGRSFNATLDAALAQAEAAYKRGGQIPGLSTGMASVDAVTDGLVPSELTILGGRPGMGKSALGWKWGVDVARQNRALIAQGGRPGHVVGISLEMSGEAISQRILAEQSGVPARAIRRGDLTDTDWLALAHARRELDGLPLRIEDASGMTNTMIRLRMRQVHRRFGISLIVIDHLHIVEDEEVRHRGGDPNARVGAAAKMAMDLAKEFHVPVLALAQLNRGSLQRDDKRPSLQDLKQSGAIEENADTVLFVHREEYFLGEAPPAKTGESPEERANRHSAWWVERDAVRGKGELIVGKLRHGAANQIIPLGFDAKRVSWFEPTVAQQEVAGGLQTDMMGDF